MSSGQKDTRMRRLHYGEVFTPPPLVCTMLDLIRADTFSLATRFLEPGCGTGNFLGELLQRKMQTVQATPSPFRPVATLQAVSSLYGIDILPDNVEVCRKRLFALIEEQGDADLYDCTRVILQRNILHGDALTQSDPGGAPLTITEWHIDRNGQVERVEFRLQDILFDLDLTKPRLLYGLPCAVWPRVHYTQVPQTVASPRHDYRIPLAWRAVVGNPPYTVPKRSRQHSPRALYPDFWFLARRLHPRHILFVIPARWYGAGRGTLALRRSMLTDSHIRELHDTLNACAWFPDIELTGGCCYVWRDQEWTGPTKIHNYTPGRIDVAYRPLAMPDPHAFIRWNRAISILEKIQQKAPKRLTRLVWCASQDLPMRPHGNSRPRAGDVPVYHRSGVAWLPAEQISPHVPERLLRLSRHYRLLLPRLIHPPERLPWKGWRRIILAPPGAVCTQTYTMVGPFKTRKAAIECARFLQTKFARFCVWVQLCNLQLYRLSMRWVPRLDFSQRWTDEQLYAYFGLTSEERKFIEEHISDSFPPLYERKSPCKTNPLER